MKPRPSRTSKTTKKGDRRCSFYTRRIYKNQRRCQGHGDANTQEETKDRPKLDKLSKLKKSKLKVRRNFFSKFKWNLKDNMKLSWKKKWQWYKSFTNLRTFLHPERKQWKLQKKGPKGGHSTTITWIHTRFKEDNGPDR